MEDDTFEKVAKSILSPATWHVDSTSAEVLRTFEICQLPLSNASTTSKEPIIIAKSLHVMESSWIAYVNGTEVPSSCVSFQDITQILSIEAFSTLISMLQFSYECFWQFR
jgi:hypothetical protein